MVVFDNYDAVVSRITHPAERLYVYEFAILPPKRISFVAGQYVSLIIPGSIPTPLSIASSPARDDAVELAVEVTGGPKTTAIKALKEGDKVVLRGPFGNFTMGDECKVCFIAGGVGITPLMSMLRSIRDAKSGVRATMVYSCRTKDEVLWLDELQGMAQLPDITIYITVTRETPADWRHSTGRVTPEIIRNLIPDFAQHVFYCCGSKEMMASVQEMLTGMGVPQEQVKREQW